MQIEELTHRVRYGMALLLVIGLPPGLVWWFIVHPLIRFWRRVGVRGTYTTLGILFFLAVGGLFSVRGLLLAREYGTQWPLVALSLPFLVTGAVIQRKRGKHLKFLTLAGVPEVDPARGSRLITEGIYARIRHPRYVEFCLSITGWALFCNYLAVYLLAAGTLAAIYAIVLMEERELRERFGEKYVNYSRRVPRFLPRRR